MKKPSIYYPQQKFVLKILDTEATILSALSQDAASVRRLLSFADAVKDSTAAAPKSASISTTHTQRITDIFVSYRVLDRLALLEGIPGLGSVDSQTRSSDLRCVERTVRSNHLFSVAPDVFFFEGVASHERLEGSSPEIRKMCAHNAASSPNRDAHGPHHYTWTPSITGRRHKDFLECPHREHASGGYFGVARKWRGE
jgi:hypothetical protein